MYISLDYKYEYFLGCLKCTEMHFLGPQKLSDFSREALKLMLHETIRNDDV